jgi:hypothetical protein
VVVSDSYRSQLHDPFYPDLANRFLCNAIVNIASGDDGDAGWGCVCAAWVCDDEGAVDAARVCRARAADYFREAEEFDDEFLPDMAQRCALVADLLRRSRQYDAAELAYAEGLAAGAEEPLRSVLRFGLELVERDDDGCHSVAEALAWSGQFPPEAAPRTQAAECEPRSARTGGAARARAAPALGSA